MKWHFGPLCGVDFETTGVNPQTDLIVTGAVVYSGEQRRDIRVTSWVSDAGGAEVPEGAARIHGYTTARIREEGRSAAEVVGQIVTALSEAADAGVPIVAMNANFDLTMLEREAERYDVRPLFVRSSPQVIDPRVIDKAVDRYRPGKRTLTDLCRYYGVALDDAHSADADALAACMVARRLGGQFPKVGDLTVAELHGQQIVWAREQAEGLADYFRRTPGKEHRADSVRTEWPLIPAQRAGGAS
jgi:DNA polymerase-3 subunit epsilon